MRSDLMKSGVDRIPHRALFRALGLTQEELDRPIIGVVCAKNEIIPGHMHLDQIAEAVKAGIRMAGGTPVEFPAIGVCDGIAMNHEGMFYSLPSWEHIADSVEIMANAHPFDGLVFIPNCENRWDADGRPAAEPAGHLLLRRPHAGRAAGGRSAAPAGRCLRQSGPIRRASMDEAGVEDYENNACPTCGSCCRHVHRQLHELSHARRMGMGLPGNGTIPAVWSATAAPGQARRDADHGSGARRTSAPGTS